MDSADGRSVGGGGVGPWVGVDGDDSDAGVGSAAMLSGGVVGSKRRGSTGTGVVPAEV